MNILRDVVRDRELPPLLRWNARRRTARLGLGSDAIGVISEVGDQRLRARRGGERQVRPIHAVHQFRRQCDEQKPAAFVGSDAELRGQPALGQLELSFAPFLAASEAAVRCA